jgi:5-dehydro-4-deoxyglucarate dehydratase
MRQRHLGYEVSVMKAVMEALGYKAGPARPPLANVTDAEREEIRTLVQELGIPTAADRAGSRELVGSAND